MSDHDQKLRHRPPFDPPANAPASSGLYAHAGSAMKHHNVPTIGVLGGGQLARMMRQASRSLAEDFSLRIMTADAEDPAALLGGHVILGDLSSVTDLRAFFRRCDVVTFESEFHLADTLGAAAEGLSCRFSPSLNALRLTQDKLQQKALCERCDIPKTPYRPMPETMAPGELLPWLEATAEALESPCGSLVLKWARFGYDGKGTLFWDKDTPAGALDSFMATAKAKGSSVYAERRVCFKRELAQVAVHSIDGSLAFYPLVVSEQESGICKRVYGPATAWGISEELASATEVFARKIAKALPLYGTFALELFEDEDGKLWLNEMAPRVHNSGHFSIDGAPCSQFENHLRAVAGLPLGETTSPGAFGMLNLISDVERERALAPVAAGPGAFPENTQLHWYEKGAARPGRKLGHINTQAANPEDLMRQLSGLEEIDASWLAALKQKAK